MKKTHKVKKNYISLITGLFLGIVIVILCILYPPLNILSWDIFGYYLYLPMSFIYHDLGITDSSIVHEILEIYKNSGTFYQATPLDNGNMVMKYTAGMAIIYAPFFFVGHLFAIFSSFPADGFSAPYQYSILIGGLIYSVAGIFILRRVLLRFFNDRITAIVLLITILGTNYLAHVAFHGQGAMSHNYLFTFYAALLWITIKWHESPKLKYAVGLGIIAGIMILARPSEIVCLVIPVLWGVSNRKTLIEKFYFFRKNFKSVILVAAIIFFIGFLQLIYWKWVSGKFIISGYGDNPGEGFEFLWPYTLKILFSFRKGWLIYTPLMLFAIFGFISLYKTNRKLFIPILIFTILNIYIVSSWSCWWYAECFSQRAMIPSYAVLALPLGYLFVGLSKRKRIIPIVVYSVIVILICLNLFQSWQHVYGILHPSRMTKDYYFAVFGKTYTTEQDRDLLLINRSGDGIDIFENEGLYDSKVLGLIDFENNDKSISPDTNFIPVLSGSNSFVMNKDNPFTSAIKIPYDKITSGSHAWIRASAWIYIPGNIQNNKTSLVVTFQYKGKNYKYRGFDIENADLKTDEWNFVSMDYLTPEVRSGKDILVVYLWYRGREQVYVDDLKVEAFVRD